MRALTDDIVTIYNTSGAAQATSVFMSESTGPQSVPHATLDKVTRGRNLLQRSTVEQMMASRNSVGAPGQLVKTSSRQSESSAALNPPPPQARPDHSSQLMRGGVGFGRPFETTMMQHIASINKISASGLNSFGDMASRVQEPMRSVESISHSFNAHLLQERNNFSSRSSSKPSCAVTSENAFMADAEKWESARSLCELSASNSLERMLTHQSQNFYDASSLGLVTMTSSMHNQSSTEAHGSGAISGPNNTNYSSDRHSSFVKSSSARVQSILDAPLIGYGSTSSESPAHSKIIRPSSSSNRRLNIPQNAAYVCLLKFKHHGLPVFDVSYYLVSPADTNADIYIYYVLF
jgi:hypothetical protein